MLDIALVEWMKLKLEIVFSYDHGKFYRIAVLSTAINIQADI